MSYNYKDGLSGDSLAQYNAKLSSVDSDCPYRCPADEWTNDPTQWPPLEYADLYHYLIRSPGSPTCVSDLHLDLRDNYEQYNTGREGGNEVPPLTTSDPVFQFVAASSA